MNENLTSNKRRIFIRSKDRVCQLFSFEQTLDGSIYCASPDFPDAHWVTIEKCDDQILLMTTESLGQGKISFHGTGMVAIRPNDNPKDHKHIVKGNYLIDLSKGMAGMRHLFTVFLKEPQYDPSNSPLFNRKSDYCLEANEELKPLVLLFFAIPKQGIEVDFQFCLHVEDMGNIPGDILGLHGFGLRYHDIFWFAYRTKHMVKWPKQSQISYHDGFTFPVFIGTGIGTYRLENRQPKYSLINNHLVIVCDQKYPDDYSNP